MGKNKLTGLTLLLIYRQIKFDVENIDHFSKSKRLKYYVF